MNLAFGSNALAPVHGFQQRPPLITLEQKKHVGTEFVLPDSNTKKTVIRTDVLNGTLHWNPLSNVGFNMPLNAKAG